MLEDFDLFVEGEFTNAERVRLLRSQYYMEQKPKTRKMSLGEIVKSDR
jgi:hypothetical protein